MSTDGGPPAIVAGALEEAASTCMGDEHGLISAEGLASQIGERVTFAPAHSGRTVNLDDFFHVVRGGTLVDIWRVQGRGRSR